MSAPNLAANPDEALIKQGIFLPRGAYTPKYEDLARAIARIGELDVTRTLPGRLVWYPKRIEADAGLAAIVRPKLVTRYKCPDTPHVGSLCGTVAVTEPEEPLDLSTALANGDSR